MVVRPRHVARDFERPLACVDAPQLRHVTLQLCQREARATNVDGRNAVCRSHRHRACGHFPHVVDRSQPGFIHRLRVRCHACLTWSSRLLHSDDTTRNEVVRCGSRRARILQGKWRCVLDHTGQAHKRAAATFTTSQRRSGWVQLSQRILPLIQCRDQCVDICICWSCDGCRCGIRCYKQFVSQFQLLILGNLQHAFLIALQGKLRTGSRNDFRIHRNAHSYTQGFQVAVSVTNPSLAFQLSDQCRSICHDISPKYRYR